MKLPFFDTGDRSETQRCPRFLRERGFSLIELLVSLAIFAIVTAMIYSVYSSFIRRAASEKSVAKTELDVTNVFWPLVKEIQSAGLGVPSSGSCTPALSVSGTELIIHSTSAGDHQHAGKWSYVGPLCDVTIPANERVVVVNSSDRSLLVSTLVNTTGKLTDCSDTFKTNFAYWSPWQGTGDLECYETRYSLTNYTSDRPARCAPGADIRKFSRSVSRTVSTNYEPVIDCVRDLDYRFGCIDTSGNLTWQTGTDCGTTAKLRLVKLGMVVQSSVRKDTLVPGTIAMFEDLGASLQKAVLLSSDQRYYTWKKREQTIALRNLE